MKTTYLFRRLDSQGDAIDVVPFDCASEEDALEAAHAIGDGGAIEVWAGSRRIFRLKPRQEPLRPDPPTAQG